MYMVTLHSAGCLPDSDGDILAFDTAAEAWDYVAEDIEWLDAEDYLTAYDALESIDRTMPGSIPAGADTLYMYSVEVTH